MSRTGLRIPLEALFGTAVAATVVAMTLRSGSVTAFAGVAADLRFPLLALAAATAVAYALVLRPRIAVGAAAYPLGGLVALALASALWSVEPGRSLAQAAAFAVLGVAAVVGAGIAAVTPTFARALLGGVAAAAVLLAAGGVVLLAVDTEIATFVLAGPQLQRFRGLGANTNTVASLAAVAAGPTIWFCTFERRAVRTGAIGALVLLAATVLASGSRGSAAALIAALAVAAALLAHVPRLRTGLVALAATVALGVVLGADERVADAVTAPATAPAGAFLAAGGPPAPPGTPPSYPGNPGRLESELGSDTVGFSSGRLEAWNGAAATALERPVAGFGFASESRAFVDRYAGFQGVYVENSLVAALLELGALGFAALATALAAAAFAAARVRRISDRHRRQVAACCASSVAAGAVLAVVLSYLLTPGNLATLPFWLGALLLSAVATPVRMRTPGRAAALVAAAALALVAALGSLQGARHTDEERDQMAALVRLAGPLDGPRLASFRLTTLLTCFGYDLGRTAWDVETCYDREGRLVDAIDRRGDEPRFATLRFEPGATPVRHSPDEIRRVLERSGGLVLAGLYYGGYPAQGLVDSTPIVIEKWLPIARPGARPAPPGTA